jgi:hypothetical protein
MDPKSSKLHHRQEQQTVNELGQHSGGRDFATVEEMLQQDAAETEVPPAIGHRLADSVAKEPKLASSWWRRFFSNRD